MAADVELPNTDLAGTDHVVPVSTEGAARQKALRQNGSDGAVQPRKKRWLCNFSRPFPPPVPGAVPELANPKFKQDMCWYATNDGCRYGQACYFAHSAEELRTPAAGRPTQKVRPRRPEGIQASESGGEWDDKWEEVLCPFFQVGCCWYSDQCVYKHEMAPKDSGYKTSLCGTYQQSGSCPNENCFGAHGQKELRTPAVWQGVPGYKACLCTFYVVEDLECGEDNCTDAHGPLDLRRLPLSVPPSLSLPFEYSDAHVHLDHVLLSRRYGSCWFYKRALCRYNPCKTRGCAWAHSEAERRKPLEMERSDLEALAAELEGLPGGTFGGCVHSCCDMEAVDDALRLVEWGRDFLGGRVFAAFGVHPTSFESWTPDAQARLEAALERCGRQGLAWGECGLDYYRRWLDIQNDSSVREAMCEVFAGQARLAVRRGLPLVVHSRDAEEDTISVLRRTVPRDHPVYLHSFMGSEAAVHEFLEGWPHGYVGVAGCVSYPAAGQLTDLARAVPLDRLLLETDGPYMAPMPHRGEESHPGHIPWIAQSVARAKGVAPAAVLAIAHANFLRFYGL